MSRECRSWNLTFSFDVLKTDKTLLGLKNLLDLFDSCHGPNGGLVSVSSDSRGHGVVTSQSSRILSTLKVNEPVNRIVCSLLTSHAKIYSDYGLFAGKLGICIVLHVSEFKENTCLVMDVLRMVLKESVQFLEEHAMSLKSEENELQSLISLSRSMLSSKALCGLSSSHLDLVSKLVVEVYLKTESPGDVVLRSIEGFNPGDTRVFAGILLDLCETTDAHELTQENTAVKIACVQTSMAGDSECFEGHAFVTAEDIFEESILEKLMDLARSIVSEQVSPSWFTKYCPWKQIRSVTSLLSGASVGLSESRTSNDQALLAQASHTSHREIRKDKLSASHFKDQ